MKTQISQLRVLLAGVSWRTFGGRRAGEILIEVLSGDDEQKRMLAGMALVKAGERTFDLIERKATSGEATAGLIRLLPDLDSPRARALLRQIAAGESGELSDTARQCLDQLQRMDALNGRAAADP